MNSRFGCLLVAAALAASAAGAQEAIPTAPAGSAAPPAARQDAPIRLSNQRSDYDDRGPVPVGPCGLPYKTDKDGALKQDKDPHGAVWGGVGTHGYREAGGAVCIPVGPSAQVNLAVDAGRWGWR